MPSRPRSQRVTDLALVLRARDWSETSQVATFLTREHGKVQVVAKGSRRAAPRFGAPIEPLVRARIAYVERKKDALRDLRELEPVDLYWRVRRGLDRTIAASYVLEVADGLAPNDEPVPELFEAAAHALADLERGAHIDGRTMAFELAALASSGFAFDLGRCAGCDAALTEGARSRLALAPWAGGVFCGRCAGGVRQAGRVSGATVAALRDLAHRYDPPGDARPRDDRLPWPEPRVAGKPRRSALALTPARTADMRAALDLVISSTLEHAPRLAPWLAGRRPAVGRPRRPASPPAPSADVAPAPASGPASESDASGDTTDDTDAG